MNLIELLKHIPLFQSLSQTTLENLSSSIRLQKLSQGQVLFRKGDEGTALYIVKEGGIKIVLRSAMGDEIIVAIFSKHDFLGSMALLDGLPRSADAICVEPSEVFVLRRADFLSVLQSDVHAIQSVLRELTTRLRQTDDILEDICFLNVSARLAKKLVDIAITSGREEAGVFYFDFPLTQKELGDMIGATRESINKELRILREKGLIDMSGGRIQVFDMERLKRRIH